MGCAKFTSLKTNPNQRKAENNSIKNVGRECQSLYQKLVRNEEESTDISTYIQRFLFFSTGEVDVLEECLQKGNISTEHSVRLL